MKKSTILAALMVSMMSAGAVSPTKAETKLSAEENASEVELVEDETTETEVTESESQKEVIVTTEDVDKLNELTEEADTVEEISDGTYIVTYNSEEEAVKAEQETFAEEEVIETEENQLFEISENSDEETDKTIQTIAEEKADESEEKNVTPSSDASDSSDTDFTDCPYRQKAEEDGKVLIAVIDTGVDPDLVIHSENFTAEESADDVNGHGTDVAKKIMEHADDNAYIVSLKAMNDKGTGYMSSIMKAIQWAIDQKVDIINLSIAAPDRGTAVSLTQLITTAIDNGIKVVASAGNYNSSAKLYLPSSINGVISVGAMDEKNNKVESSNYAADYYEVADSTSMAAGIFTGKIAGGCDFEKEKTDSDIEYEIEKINTGVLSLGGTTRKMDEDGIITATAPINVNVSENVRRYMNDNETGCNKVIATVNDISAVIDEMYVKALYDSTYSSYIYTFEKDELCDDALNKLIEGNNYYGIVICGNIDDLMNHETNAYSISVKLKYGEGLNDAVASLNADIDGCVIATRNNPTMRYQENAVPHYNVTTYKYIAKYDEDVVFEDVEALAKILELIKVGTSNEMMHDDNECPVFTQYSDVMTFLKRDDNYDISKEFIAVDNSGEVTLEAVNYDLTKTGTYKAEVIATDKDGNKTSRKVTVHVIDEESGIHSNSVSLSYETIEEPIVKEDITVFEQDDSYVDELFEVQASKEFEVSSIEEIPEELIGDGGKLFKTFEEAEKWAVAEETDPNSEWYGMVPSYRVVSKNPICQKGDPWTVDFF